MIDQESIRPMSIEERMAKIETFSLVIKGKRDRAVNARKASGIEEIWQEDQDHREGIDNASGKSSKPRSPDASFNTQPRKVVTGRSTAFCNITRPYSDAAAARVSDLLLPSDERNWALKITPDPVLIMQSEDMRDVIGGDGKPIPHPQKPNMLKRMSGAISGMFGAQNPEEDQEQPKNVTVADYANDKIKQARKKAERAQEVIDDWLTECTYNAEVRKVIETTANIGVGILKGPIPERRKSRAVKKTDTGWEVFIEEKIVPVSKFVDPWNFYPDPNCGELIENGDFVFEYDEITARGLKDLKDSGGYIAEMIDLCLEEGASNRDAPRSKDDKELRDDDMFGIWYFYGHVSKKDMEAAGCYCDEEIAPCIVTMVNNRIIKIALSPFDTGDFPYDVMVWQKKQNHWAGIGIARQMRTEQKGLNGGVRQLMDNSAISSGPQIIIDTSKIEPADGVWVITPNKLWRKKADADEVGDVRQAFISIGIESRQIEIMNIINFWLKTAEDVTGLPMLLQGQQGTAPDTVGGMTMLNNNANSILRRIARTFDDRVTTRHIGRYYEWLLLHGPDDAKGDFQIEARGSSALIERDMQSQAVMQLLNMSMNPAYGIDPEKVAKEVIKSMRFDYRSFEIDPEKKEQAAQPPMIPAIEVAKIRQQTEMQKAQMQIQGNAQENQIDRQVEQQQFEAKNKLDQMKILVQKMAIEANAQLGAANLDASEREVLNNIKADLAGITMKLQTQKELSTQVITPASEPAGRAPNGEAFQR